MDTQWHASTDQWNQANPKVKVLDEPICLSHSKGQRLGHTSCWPYRVAGGPPSPPQDADSMQGIPALACPGQDPATRQTTFPTRERSLNETLDLANMKIWNDRKETIIRNPYAYVASQPGKEFRTLVLNAFNVWLKVPAGKLSVIANVVRTLHTASLLIDDIQDNSLLRRGRPVAHRVYGVAQTINAANYQYFVALDELQKLSNPSDAVEIYRSEMLRLHQGQGMELHWRDTLTCPSEEEYIEMISNKTGGLFRLAVRLMQSESSSGIDCMSLVQLLGLIFQIVDDYKNLADSDYTQLKGVCEDLTEGKFSFPVIHSIRSDSTNGQLLSILAQRPSETDVKLAAVDYIKSTGSLDYTKKVVGELISQAKQAIDDIDDGRGESYGVHAILKKLALE